MIPLRDYNPSHRFPIVTTVIISINVVVFLFVQVPLNTSGNLMSFFDRWAVIPLQLVSNFGPEAPTVFSAMFLHGGWSHLLGNMLYLWIFGDNVEDAMGPFGFLVFYLLSGLLATTAQVLIDPTSAIPNIGASGAIAGVLGGYLVLYPRVRVVTVIPLFIFIRLANVPAVLVLGFWFVIQLFNGVAQLGTIQMQQGGVAFFAHVGGFVTGVLLVRLFTRAPTSTAHSFWEELYR